MLGESVIVLISELMIWHEKMGLYTNVTGFAKTQHNPARIEIHFAYHESHTLALYIRTLNRAKDDQVCFHRQHLSDHVNS